MIKMKLIAALLVLVAPVYANGIDTNLIAEMSATVTNLVYQDAQVTGLPLQSQTALQDALRNLIFVPNAGALPIGTSDEVTLTLPTAGNGLSVAGMTVSGTPTVIGTVPVEVAATDESGAGALDTFGVIVLVDGVLLEATPRNLWDLEFFGKAVVNPALESTLWGGYANADSDASNNDCEYAFGGDPTAADTGGLILLSAAADGNMVITYIRRRDDPALTYTVQGTVTLAPPVWVDVQTWVLDEQVTFIDDA